VFESITLEPPLLVIDVLAAAGVVGADCLQMSVGSGTDPDLFPSRRDDEQLATLDVLCGKAVSGLVEINESLPGPAPRPSHVLRGDPSQPRHIFTTTRLAGSVTRRMGPSSRQ
jgi:hypothetical protein